MNTLLTVGPLSAKSNNLANINTEAVVPFRKPYENGIINQRLPNEILIQVFGALPPEALAKARKVCEHWRHLIDSEVPKRCFQRFEQIPLLRSFMSMNQDTVMELIGNEDAMVLDDENTPQQLLVLMKSKVHNAWSLFTRSAGEVELAIPSKHPYFISLARLVRLQDKLIQRIKDRAIIAFCSELPQYIQDTLPALNSDQPLHFMAELLRLQLSESDEVRDCQVLDFSGCGLTHLPEEIQYFQSLISLNLYQNKLVHVCPEIGSLSQLRELCLKSNEIESLPDIFAGFIHLERLWIDDNRLNELPLSIASLAHLEELDASNNQLGELPEDIGALGNLNRLILSSNQLRELPASFIQLRSLEFCSLTDNRLEALPQGFGQNFPGLEELYLGRNELAMLPDSFGFCQNLSSLELDENRLIALPHTFRNLHSLMEVNLANNLLTDLPAGFSELSELEDLKLDHNQFELFPNALFGLNSLVILNINDNQIRALPDRFAEIPELRTIDVSNNALRTLPESLSRMRISSEGNMIRNERLGPAMRENFVRAHRYRPY